MPEIRRNVLTGELVIISVERAKRPMTFGKQSVAVCCPFCPENVHLTPPDHYKSENEKVRVFDNKYPIFIQEDNEAYGRHEVLVDTNRHEERLHHLLERDIYEVFKAIVIRQVVLEEDSNINYVQVFKNEGRKAGASLEHSHWQIVASSYIPQKQTNIAKNANEYTQEHGSCYLCDTIQNLDSLLVTENESFVSYCPYASNYPYELNITSKRHCSSLTDFSEEELRSLSKILKTSLYALSLLFDDFSYNICLYNTIKHDAQYEYDKILHFHLQVIPRMGNMAGFEFSTDSHINSIYPEEATKHIRAKLKA